MEQAVLKLREYLGVVERVVIKFMIFYGLVMIILKRTMCYHILDPISVICYHIDPWLKQNYNSILSCSANLWC